MGWWEFWNARTLWRLEKSHVQYRIQFATALGDLRNPRAVRLLLEIGARNYFLTEVEAAVVDALVRIGPSGVDQLITALTDTREGVRVTAVKALEKIGDKLAIEPLRATLRKDRTLDVLMAAAKAIATFTRPLTDDEAAKAQAAYRGAMTDHEAGEAFAAFTSSLTDIDRALYISAVLAVERHTSFETDRRIAGILEGIGPSSTDQLITALTDPHEWACASAARALGEFGEKRAIEPLLAALRPFMATVKIIPVGGLLPNPTIKSQAIASALIRLRALEGEMTDQDKELISAIANWSVNEDRD
jgi:HEAT repeat protein